ncbi:MAG TPA: tRNA lysidine(34) synthetase TilS [Candidatus Babeliales bacterium]|nr:tRNA lysidine(34) synthetase TilS [Candidatus Babeliales bacterium]
MKKTIKTAINSYISEHNLIPTGSNIILGLSGGPDSVFLLHYLADLQTQGVCSVIAAHLDHEWRPESYKDVQFCSMLTKQLEVPFVSAKLSELSLSVKYNGSQEEIGRKARRSFLEKVRTDYNGDFIALAHHADDQQETFFIRLIRGASLAGLTAMKPKQGAYIRPLLNISKADILAYLHEHTIPYLIDPSNNSDNYLRNRIRNHVLPGLKESDARFDHNFKRTLQQLQHAEQFMAAHALKTFESISTRNEHNHYQININQFLELDPILQHRIFVHWFCQMKIPFIPSQAFFDEIIRFLQQSENGKHQIHPTWKIIKKAGKLGILIN